MRFMANKIEEFMEAFDEGMKKGDEKIDLKAPKIGGKLSGMKLNDPIKLNDPVKLKDQVTLDGIIEL